jgi:agmatine deiminase
MPVYRQEYDTTAVRIIKENMPGYKVVTIDADNTGSNIIQYSGVIHCITHSVGVSDPLRIVHNYLNNTYNTTTPYQIDAIVQHKSGIQNATLYYTTDTAAIPYTAVNMTLTNGTTDTWTGYIPAQPAGTHVSYYIKGRANSGKEQVRPMPAPAGTFEFDVLGTSGINNIANNDFIMRSAYPNPSHGITCIPVSFNKNTEGSIKLYDILGNMVALIYEGAFSTGEKNYFLNSVDLNVNPGAYLIVVETNAGSITQKLMVR